MDTSSSGASAAVSGLAGPSRAHNTPGDATRVSFEINVTVETRASSAGISLSIHRPLGRELMALMVSFEDNMKRILNLSEAQKSQIVAEKQSQGNADDHSEGNADDQDDNQEQDYFLVSVKATSEHMVEETLCSLTFKHDSEHSACNMFGVIITRLRQNFNDSEMCLISRTGGAANNNQGPISDKNKYDLAALQVQLNKKEAHLDEEQSKLEQQQTDLKESEEELKQQQAKLKTSEENLNTREENLNAREVNLNAREVNLKTREEELNTREQELAQREVNLNKNGQHLPIEGVQSSAQIGSFDVVDEYRIQASAGQQKGRTDKNNVHSNSAGAHVMSPHQEQNTNAAGTLLYQHNEDEEKNLVWVLVKNGISLSHEIKKVVKDMNQLDGDEENIFISRGQTWKLPCVNNGARLSAPLALNSPPISPGHHSPEETSSSNNKRKRSASLANRLTSKKSKSSGKNQDDADLLRPFVKDYYMWHGRRPRGSKAKDIHWLQDQIRKAKRETSKKDPPYQLPFDLVSESSALEELSSSSGDDSESSSGEEGDTPLEVGHTDADANAVQKWKQAYFEWYGKNPRGSKASQIQWLKNQVNMEVGRVHKGTKRFVRKARTFTRKMLTAVGATF